MSKSDPKNVVKSTGNPFDLLNTMFDFIVRVFKDMPKVVQVAVYVFIVGLFAFGFLRLLQQFVKPSEVDIRGDIALMGRGAIPDSMSPVEVYGEKFFVAKTWTGDGFIYEWILTLAPGELAAEQQLVLSKYNPETRRSMPFGRGGRFSRAILRSLSEKSADKKVHLALDDILMAIDLDTTVHKLALAEDQRVSPFNMSSFLAFAGQAEQRQGITLDSSRALVRQFKRSNNAAMQIQINRDISRGSSAIMLDIADSLKTAVLSGRKSDVALFASLLANSDSLAELTSAGLHSDRFDLHFYQEAVGLLNIGDEFEQRNIATLLWRLQDARAIGPVFGVFDAANNPTTKKLCLYVLGAYATNSDPAVKRRVCNWLELEERNTTSEEMRTAIGQTVRRFLAN